MKNVKDRQIPCRIRNCKNTWTLTAREQQLLGDSPVPDRMCDECYALLNTLQDKELVCKIRGCGHTIPWNRFQQLEHIRAGKSAEATPSRMCPSCFALSRKLENREVPCRIRGCKHTWTFTVNEQIEQILAGKVKKEDSPAAKEASGADAVEAAVPDAGTAVPPVVPEETPQPEAVVQAESVRRDAAGEKEHPKTSAAKPVPEAIPPSRMCRECYDFFRNAVDTEEPCRNRNCKNTWTYTRSMQLTQRQYAQGRVPVRYCDECTQKLKSLEDKQMPCSQKGCDGTWLYSRDEQLKDGSAGREPKPRRCRKCNDFLSSHSAVVVTCEECGKPVEVSSAQQLEIELGESTMPTRCADCNRKMLQEIL
jgi:hypothetical protein